MCINYHQIFRIIQIYSLPYKFSNNIIDCTIDLIHTKFNVNEDENRIVGKNLSVTFEPLWHGMRWLCLSFNEKQKIPIVFLEALQYLHGRSKLVLVLLYLFFRSLSFVDKILVLLNERGVLPDNVESQLQLTHFSTLQLKSLFDTNSTYDFQGIVKIDLMNIYTAFLFFFYLNCRINSLASCLTTHQMFMYRFD